MHKRRYLRRFQIVLGLFFCFFCLIIARIFFIQFFHSRYLKELADRQHNFSFELEPKRGIVYDRNLEPLTVNVPVESLYAIPPKIKNKEATIERLSQILGLDKAFLKERIHRNKSFIWIARKLDPKIADLIRYLDIDGLEFIRENKRSYPNGSLASHVLGFAGTDNIGLEGVELYYDSYLRGKSGWCQILRDAKQDAVLFQDLIRPINGNDIVLTIDGVAQYIAERSLDEVFKKYHAKGATIIVMEPQTGKILAFANRPTFDLNDVRNSSADERRNRAICDLFEPGSVFKIVIATAALEENIFKEQDKFFCENGEFKVANHILHDHKPHGWLTFSEVIQQSSNIGVCKIAQKAGAENISKYIGLFGFGSKLSIDLPGEVSGIVRPPKMWSKTSIAAIPMGQEVGVTALQLASAISAIANNGFLMKPYILERIQAKDKEVIKEFQPQVLKKVMSLETSRRLTQILTMAVEQGTGILAKIDGIRVAGKTGTAQKLEPNGAYSHKKFMASFIGFAPSDNPVISVVVVVDEPHPYYFGGVVSAPVFKKVVLDILSYLKIKQIENKSINIYEAKRADWQR